MLGSHTLAVSFGPVEYISTSSLLEGGAFTALVDLDSGAVTLTPVRATYSYFSPRCGANGKAQFTSFGVSESNTSVTEINNDGRAKVLALDVPGEYTDATALPDGHLLAAHGSDLVSLTSEGARLSARVDGSITQLRLTKSGTPVFATVRDKDTAVQTLAGSQITTLATGTTGSVAIDSYGKAGVAIHGSDLILTDRPLPSMVVVTSVPQQLRPSVNGTTWVAANLSDAANGGTAMLASLDGAATTKVRMPAASEAQTTTSGSVTTPQLLANAAAGVATTSSTTDANLPCAVQRNDVRTQAFQPSVDQIEWAVDRAVLGQLTPSRAAGYRQFGLPAYSPQRLFPLTPLSGGGSVPPQVLLGILANESNMWQASSHVASGGYGNPLTGNIYGRSGDGLAINFSNADCGYGVAQVTDGMRAGQQNATTQRAIALDYQVNIAAGLNILISKWNQLRNLPTPITMNDGSPQWLENWYAAIWAYNTGIQPNSDNGNTTGCAPSPSCTDSNGYWGLGWANNPANPIYPPGRHMFNSNVLDAASPASWPYQERVIGWAAYPIFKNDQETYAQAWWTSNDARNAAIPAPAKFCTTQNGCSGASSNWPPASSTQGACNRSDSHCWTNFSVTWKNCSNGSCGHSDSYYSPTAPEPPDMTTADPADCTTTGLPAGAVIVDDVPSSTPVAGASCKPTATVGSFTFTFNSDTSGNYPSHIDLHQVNGGFDGHYWFTHTVQSPGVLASYGTWTFPSTTTGWGSVYVHVPALGAQTTQAHYRILDGETGAASDRWISQYWGTNHWFRLGTYNFTAGEKIQGFSLSGHDGASVDFAWDAVAFAPTGAPAYKVAVLGDSYSAGEGLEPYFNDSDNQADLLPDACHRSSKAYAYLFRLPGSQTPAAQRSDVDLRFAACSGAHTTSLTGSAVSPSGAEIPYKSGWDSQRYEHGEALQVNDTSAIDPAASGALDSQTSLVALTIGGNDARFSDVVTYCTTNIAKDCNAAGQIMPGDPSPLAQYEPHVINDLLPAHLQATYSSIHTKAPNAAIYVLGYPRIFDQNPLAGCNAISTGEEKWLNTMADSVDAVINSTVSKLKATGIRIYFVPTAAAFNDHEVCSIDEWINDIIATSSSGSGRDVPVGAGSFHPKAAGQQAFADALTQSISSQK